MFLKDREAITGIGEISTFFLKICPRWLRMSNVCDKRGNDVVAAACSRDSHIYQFLSERIIASAYSQQSLAIIRSDESMAHWPPPSSTCVTPFSARGFSCLLNGSTPICSIWGGDVFSTAILGSAAVMYWC